MRHPQSRLKLLPRDLPWHVTRVNTSTSAYMHRTHRSGERDARPRGIRRDRAIAAFDNTHSPAGGSLCSTASDTSAPEMGRSRADPRLKRAGYGARIIPVAVWEDRHFGHAPDGSRMSGASDAANRTSRHDRPSVGRNGTSGRARSAPSACSRTRAFEDYADLCVMPTIDRKPLVAVQGTRARVVGTIVKGQQDLPVGGLGATASARCRVPAATSRDGSLRHLAFALFHAAASSGDRDSAALTRSSGWPAELCRLRVSTQPA